MPTQIEFTQNDDNSDHYGQVDIHDSEDLKYLKHRHSLFVSKKISKIIQKSNNF